MNIYDEKENCCGCGVCENACPKEAIKMVSDKKGFLYPKVDETKCIGCELCKKICPIATEMVEKEPKEILQFMHLTDIFVALCDDEQLLFTFCFNTDWEIEHGIDWIIKGKLPIYVGQDGLNIHIPEHLKLNRLD